MAWKAGVTKAMVLERMAATEALLTVGLSTSQIKQTIDRLSGGGSGG